MPHNHAPRCCCSAPQSACTIECDQPSCQMRGECSKELEVTQGARCTSCPEHGDLAQLSQPTECPACHTHDGHPHTDYCRRPQIQGERGPELFITSEPGTRISQPVTITRDMIEGPAHPSAYDVIQAEQAQASRAAAGYCTGCGSNGHQHIIGCKYEPTPLATPTPGQCASCHRDYDHTPTPTCRYPASHDHPR